MQICHCGGSQFSQWVLTFLILIGVILESPMILEKLLYFQKHFIYTKKSIHTDSDLGISESQYWFAWLSVGRYWQGRYLLTKGRCGNSQKFSQACLLGLVIPFLPTSQYDAMPCNSCRALAHMGTFSVQQSTCTFSSHKYQEHPRTIRIKFS